jgi:predicted kinase
MASVHLISGLPCSGKTTYSKELRSETESVHFSLDYWLITIFGRYVIREIGHEEHVRRVLACRELIWSVSAEFIKRGTDVILDDGFFLRDDRMKVSAMAHALGAKAIIHFLDVSPEILKERLEARNADLPQYNFDIKPETLEGFFGLYEKPLPDEEADLLVINEKDGKFVRLTTASDA